MGNFYMESTQINYRRDEKLKTVDQKLQELSETSAIDTDIAPVFKSTNTYQPGDMVYYRNKLYVFNVDHTGAWASADVTATDVTSAMNAAIAGKADYADLAGAFNSETAYTAGDLVIYNGIVYRCTNDHTGAWDADDFSATTIAAELNSINSNLTSNIVEYKTDVEAPVRVNLFNKDSLDKANKYYDGTEWHNVSSDGWITVFIPVIGGVTYTASGFPAQGGVKTVFTTGDKTTVLSDFSASENNSTRTAPNNAKYIGFGIYSPNADYTSAQFEIGSTATTYAAYTPSINERLEKLEKGIYGRAGGGSITD